MCRYRPLCWTEQGWVWDPLKVRERYQKYRTFIQNKRIVTLIAVEKKRLDRPDIYTAVPKEEDAEQLKRAQGKPYRLYISTEIQSFWWIKILKSSWNFEGRVWNSSGYLASPLDSVSLWKCQIL